VSTISSTIEIDRPPREVFEYVTDPSRFSEWQQGVLDGQMQGNAPYAPGDRCLMTRRIGGARREVTSEITNIDPPTAWRVRGIDGPLRAEVDVAVTALGEARSRITIALGFTGHGLGKLLVPLVQRSAKGEMPTNLRRLKERLESDNRPGPR
jgi:uncharacterized protein YndB with AHSA1/START domain